MEVSPDDEPKQVKPFERTRFGTRNRRPPGFDCARPVGLVRRRHGAAEERLADVGPARRSWEHRSNCGREGLGASAGNAPSSRGSRTGTSQQPPKRFSAWQLQPPPAETNGRHRAFVPRLAPRSAPSRQRPRWSTTLSWPPIQPAAAPAWPCRPTDRSLTSPTRGTGGSGCCRSPKGSAPRPLPAWIGCGFRVRPHCLRIRSRTPETSEKALTAAGTSGDSPATS